MEHQKSTENDPAPPPYQAFRSPGGLDVDPDPPDTVRVSKRAAILGIGVLCALAGAFGFGVYQRQNQNAKTSLAAADSRKIAPATVAAREIMKDIPTGVVNLADEKQLAGTGAPVDGTAAEASVVASTSASTKVSPVERPISPSVQQIPAYREPSPEEKQAALMAERRLQAQLAPTSTGGVSSRTVPPVRESSPTRSPEGLPVAELARALLKPNGNAQTSAADALEDAGLQARKEAFLGRARTPPSEHYLKSMRTPPLSRYEIKAGWEIPAVMEQALNSDLPGELKALVASNVYDSASGRFLLIPQGSRIIGTYDSMVAYGQSGVQVVWNRVLFPDGSSMDLGGMIGQDAQGFSGFRDKVDNHYKRLISTTVLSSLFSAGFQVSQTRRGSILQTPSTSEIAASAVGREVSQLGAQISRKNLNVQPTIRIPVGYRFNVRVNRDILFDSPYGQD